MTSPDTHAAWRAERHRRAQAFALGWAERAETEYDNAVQHEDRALSLVRSSYQGDAVAIERRLAQFHGVRSTEALKLAEMWARVAGAFNGIPGREHPADGA